MWGDRPLRALLFAPGSHRARVQKVATFGADAIVLDLEDAVAELEKSAARQVVRSTLPEYGPLSIVLVRVNALATGELEADLDAAVCDRLDGIIVPKVEASESLSIISAMLSRIEREREVAEGSIGLLPLIETPRGVVECEEIALQAPPRVVTLIFGAADYSMEMGIDLTQDALELLYARSRLAVAARAAGLRGALDGPYGDIKDLDGLAVDTDRSRRLGFEGRVVIHPAQVEVVQRAYVVLSSEELERARRIVTAFEEAQSRGSAAIQVDGRFVDYPIYRRALRQVRLSESTDWRG